MGAIVTLSTIRIDEIIVVALLRLLLKKYGANIVSFCMDDSNCFLLLLINVCNNSCVITCGNGEYRIDKIIVISSDTPDIMVIPVDCAVGCGGCNGGDLYHGIVSLVIPVDCAVDCGGCNVGGLYQGIVSFITAGV